MPPKKKSPSKKKAPAKGGLSLTNKNQMKQLEALGYAAPKRGRGKRK